MRIPASLLSYGVCVAYAATKVPGQPFFMDGGATAATVAPLPAMTIGAIAFSSAPSASSSSVSSLSAKSSSSSVPPASSASVSANSSASAHASATPASVIQKRTAIPACIKTVELSCLNLAANCMSNIGGNPANINSLWTVRSCVAAATCYGVGDLINSVECQTGLVTTNRIQASLPQDIYAKFVGTCTTCAITQQNYIDYYYGQLTAINSANFPSSSNVVKAFWAAITAWAATGDTVPYKNFNDYLLFSSAPTTTTTITEPPVPTYTQIDWNPNPAPPSGAKSETFVSGTSTKIIAIPTASTTVVIVNATITLAPGGTPVGGVIPPGITLPGAVTPTWNPNIIPPKSVPSITFTAPGRSWTTVVAVPTASNAPPKNVTGPPGDKNDNGDDWWLLLFGALIGGLLPKDVGIPGGVTPTAAPPPDWTGGGWVDPDPTSSSDPDNQSQSASKSASKSQSSTSTCPTPTPTYSLSDDSENSDWDLLGSDPDRRRSEFKWTREVEFNKTGQIARRESDLERRVDKARHIAVNTCGIQVTNSRFVSLGVGDYYTIGLKVPIGTGSNLGVTQVNSRPLGNGAGEVAQEHIFELGYIDDFFSEALSVGISCNWIQASVFSTTRRDGSDMGMALLNAIDTPDNMVWVDRPLNQAKSNVVNDNRKTATNPPQKDNIDKITSFASVNLIQDVEYFARNLAALGTYFGATAAEFQATALRVQNLLAEITPISNDAHLPVEFNNWLRGIVANYPAGCTTRAANTYNYYTNRMQAVSQGTNPPTPIPACAPLFSSGLNIHTFTWQNLIPPAPTLPRCDIPGTTGQISLAQTAAGQYLFEVGTFRIMGSGNSQFFALGRGANIAGDHWMADDLTASYPGCQGVYQMFFDTPASGYPSANIALNCNGQVGNTIIAPFTFVVNGQQLSCVLLNKNDGTGQYYTICGPTAASTTTCATNARQALIGTYPQSTLSTPTFRFHP